MTNEELLQGVERATLPAAAFSHREHLRLAWAYGGDGDQLAEALRAYAAHVGSPDRYNETLTRVWGRLVAAARARHPEAADFDALLARHPELLERELPFRYYSRERLMAPEARAAWVEPDLRPLPR